MENEKNNMYHFFEKILLDCDFICQGDSATTDGISDEKIINGYFYFYKNEYTVTIKSWGETFTILMTNNKSKDENNTIISYDIPNKYNQKILDIIYEKFINYYSDSDLFDIEKIKNEKFDINEQKNNFRLENKSYAVFGLYNKSPHFNKLGIFKANVKDLNSNICYNLFIPMWKLDEFKNISFLFGSDPNKRIKNIKDINKEDISEELYNEMFDTYLNSTLIDKGATKKNKI